MSESGKKSAAHPKVFDIMRPGKAQPSPTSRPIIVGHKPQVQDSTLTDKPAPAADKPPVKAKRELMDGHDEVSVEPPAPTEVAEPSATAAASVPPMQSPAPTEPEPEPLAQSVPEPEQPEASADEIPAAPPESAALAETEPAVIAQPVVSFHHKHAGKHPLKWLAVLVIILVLAAVILDILLDAGAITVTNIPHTHFF